MTYRFIDTCFRVRTRTAHGTVERTGREQHIGAPR